MKYLAPNSKLKGFLIDLDYAQRLKEHPPNEPEYSPCVTGTPPFMALELLLSPPVYHTWRHDLESFFYVLAWLCIQNPERDLTDWGSGYALRKREDVTLDFEARVLSKVREDFSALKSLLLRFRDILFYSNGTLDWRSHIAKLGTPVGDAARCEMYDRVIGAFDNCISDLRHISEAESSDDGWECIEPEHVKTSKMASASEKRSNSKQHEGGSETGVHQEGIVG